MEVDESGHARAVIVFETVVKATTSTTIIHMHRGPVSNRDDTVTGCYQVGGITQTLHYRYNLCTVKVITD